MAKATIGDVAKYAKVSVKTVSRVLNHEKNVRASTKEKIEKAIKALNYSPNISARRLRSNKSYILGIIYADYSNNSYGTALISGALTTCDKYGYDLLIRPIKIPSPNATTDIEQMAERSNIDGFLIAPPLCDDSAITNTVESLGIPYVRISSIAKLDSTKVNSDEVNVTAQAINHLISLGHTKIAFISYLVGHAAGTWRYEGYCKALQEANIPLNEQYIEQTKGTSNSLDDYYGQAVRKLLTLPTPPTAIFASNDFIASIVYRIAQQMGIKIPYQLSIIGFDNDPMAANLWPPLTTIKQPIMELSKLATEILIKNLLSGNKDYHPAAPLCELIIRNSTGPIVA